MKSLLVIFLTTLCSQLYCQVSKDLLPTLDLNRKVISLSELKGSYTYGDTIRYNFEFMNSGLSTLEIEEIRSSCSCTVADVSSYSIEQGQAGYIQLQTSYDQLLLFKSVYIVIIANTRKRYYKIKLTFD